MTSKGPKTTGVTDLIEEKRRSWEFLCKTIYCNNYNF